MSNAAEKARLTTLARRSRTLAEDLRRQAEHTRHPWERKAVLDRAGDADAMAEEAEQARAALEERDRTP